MFIGSETLSGVVYHNSEQFSLHNNSDINGKIDGNKNALTPGPEIPKLYNGHIFLRHDWLNEHCIFLTYDIYFKYTQFSNG